MILAATIGTVVPMFFKQIGVDPAVATGPFVTTSIDVLGIFSTLQLRVPPSFDACMLTAIEGIEHNG